MAPLPQSLLADLSWGQIAYELWASAQNWVSEQGQPIPRWPDVSPRLKTTFDYVAVGLLSHNLETQGQALLVTIVRKMDDLLTQGNRMAEEVEQLRTAVTEAVTNITASVDRAATIMTEGTETMTASAAVMASTQAVIERVAAGLGSAADLAEVATLASQLSQATPALVQLQANLGTAADSFNQAQSDLADVKTQLDAILPATPPTP